MIIKYSKIISDSILSFYFLRLLNFNTLPEAFKTYCTCTDLFILYMYHVYCYYNNNIRKCFIMFKWYIFYFFISTATCIPLSGKTIFYMTEGRKRVSSCWLCTARSSASKNRYVFASATWCLNLKKSQAQSSSLLSG